MDDLQELRARLDRAAGALAEMADGARSEAERHRLLGKAEGARLALSYIYDMERATRTGVPEAS